MKIELDNFIAGRNRIEAYTTGQITVSNDIYYSSLLVSPDSIVSDWPPQQFSGLLRAHIEQILSLDPEIVLLGTGRNLIFPSDSVMAPLTAANIGFEIMDTGAACRSYNFLVNEDRNVIAALFMIET